MTAEPHVADLLAQGTLTVLGRLPQASNITLAVQVEHPDHAEWSTLAVYKPSSGERALHDFPTGTLGHREVAAALISGAAGWNLIPPTVLREGPLGIGSVQAWVGPRPDGAEPEGASEQAADMLGVFAPDQVPEQWRPVVMAATEDGDPLVVAHRDSPQLQSLAVLDLVLNNADRKGAHLIEVDEQVWGIDHGLCLHAQPKLRTVLWGWAGERLPVADQQRLQKLAHLCEQPAPWDDLVSDAERAALAERVQALLDEPVFPQPDPDRYPLPWPLW